MPGVAASADPGAHRQARDDHDGGERVRDRPAWTQSPSHRRPAGEDEAAGDPADEQHDHGDVEVGDDLEVDDLHPRQRHGALERVSVRVDGHGVDPARKPGHAYARVVPERMADACALGCVTYTPRPIGNPKMASRARNDTG